MEISHLRELQDHFETNRANTPEAQELYKRSEDLISRFQQKFKRDKLLSMTLQEYVVGNKSKDSFCYWLAFETSGVGEIFVGGAALSFGICYGKADSAYRVPEGGDKSRVASDDEASKQMERIKAGLVELLNFAEKKAFADMMRVSKQLPLDYQVARCLVPKMVKNGFYSSFVYWSLIWACLTGNLDRVERWQITGFHQSSMEVEFSHKLLKLHLVPLGRQGTEEG